MSTHSSVLAWRIPWTEEPGGSQKVGHDWVTMLTHMTYPLHCGFLSNFVLSGIIRYSMLLYISCPSLSVSHACKEPWFLLLKKHTGTSVFVDTRIVLLLGPFS